MQYLFLRLTSDRMPNQENDFLLVNLVRPWFLQSAELRILQKNIFYTSSFLDRKKGTRYITDSNVQIC